MTRMVPFGLAGQGDQALHSRQEVPWKARKYDKRKYRRRNRIEIMFGRRKDWRRVATRYDRSPKVFLSAATLAATLMFWL